MQYVRNPGETYDVIVIVANGPFSDLTDYLNGSKKMTVDVFSPAVGIPLQITLARLLQQLEQQIILMVDIVFIQLQLLLLMSGKQLNLLLIHVLIIQFLMQM